VEIRDQTLNRSANFFHIHDTLLNVKQGSAKVGFKPFHSDRIIFYAINQIDNE